MNDLILKKIRDHFANDELKKYPSNHLITLANQSPDGVSLLESGVVEQYDITPEGNKIVVNIFKPPAFFPMSWAINHTQNTYFYSALTDVELRQSDPDKTVQFLKDNPDVMFDLLSRLYKGTDALLKRLVLTARGIASNRLIFELIIEAYRFGIAIDDTKVIISIQQSVLASRSGLARETVSREMHKLEHDDLIALTKQGIILNLKQLEAKLDHTI